MKILNRLPYLTTRSRLTVRGEAVEVKRYQIILWASVTAARLPAWDANTPLLPVILDTGNSHNFSVRVSHLLRWAGIPAESLALLGVVRDKGQRVLLRAADVWLHPNRPGEREVRRDRKPLRLNLAEGIALYPDEANWPRLPLLGLRALTDNELHLAVNGKRRHATVSTVGPWWWPFG